MMHKIYLAFIFTLLPLLLVAQQKECIEVEWSKHFGGQQGDAANDMQPTADGGFILAGYARSGSQTLTANYGGADFWVVKLDAGGNLEWQRNFGGSGNDIASSLTQTPDGGYLVAGGTVSFDQDVDGNHGLEDVWIIKLGTAGDLLWAKTYGGSDNERAESIRPASGGGYVVAGYSESSDGDLIGNKGNFDYWIFKINESGGLQWQKGYGGSQADFAFDARSTPDGGYLVAGSTVSDDADVTANFGFYDYWLVKLDADGNLVWQDNYGGSDEERAYALEVASDGSAYIAGTSNSSGNDLPGNNGSADVWVLHISATGAVLWSKNLGGPGEDRSFALAAGNDGNVLAAGFATGTGSGVSANYGSRDAWVVNLGADGDLLWEKNFGGSLDDRFFSFLALPDGGFAAAGFSTSADHDLDGNFGEQDLWAIRLSPDTLTIDLGNDTTLCAGQGVLLQLEDGEAFDYLWKDGSMLPVFLVNTAGEYWLETDRNGCKSRDTVLVDYVSETPVTLGPDTILCEGETLVLNTGIAGAEVFWNDGSTDPTLPVQTPGDYWVEVSKDGCEYRDTVAVDFTTVDFDLGGNRKLCAGQTVLLDVTLPSATYLWQDGSTSPIYEVKLPGKYSVLVTQGGCQRSDTLLVEVQPLPENLLPDTAFLCEGEALWLDATFPQSQYAWQDGSTAPKLKAVTPGFYSVSVTVNNCLYEEETEIRDCERCLYIPNAFSPNGDGFNDDFRGFPGCDFTGYVCRVFDRWGAAVFVSNDVNVGWNGSMNGKKATQGSYLYRIEFDVPQSGGPVHRVRQGTVALVR